MPAGGSWGASVRLILPDWEQASHRTAGRSSSLPAGRTERYYFREKNEILVIAYSSCRNVGVSQPGPRGEVVACQQRGELIACGDVKGFQPGTVWKKSSRLGVPNPLSKQNPRPSHHLSPPSAGPSVTFLFDHLTPCYLSPLPSDPSLFLHL